MATYNYECRDCEKKTIEEYTDKLIEDDGGIKLPPDLYEEFVLFETSHSMSPTEEELYEATECPRCEGHNCEKTMYGANVIGYIKGYGWLDRAGATRDMNRCKLKDDDPYAQYRVDGEVDHIDNQLKKGGIRNPRTKRFLIDTNTMEKAVTKVSDTPTPLVSPSSDE